MTKSNDAMTPTERVQQSFYQLNFMIKLLPWFEERKIPKVEFDREHRIRLETHLLVLKANMFNTEEDLVIGAHNGLMITVGCSAIAMDVALEEVGAPESLDGSNYAAVACLVRLIRCAFAHDMMTPKWKIDRKYPSELAVELSGKPTKIPLRKIHGKLFHTDDLGGYENYFKLRDEVLKYLDAAGAKSNVQKD